VRATNTVRVGGGVCARVMPTGSRSGRRRSTSGKIKTTVIYLRTRRREADVGYIKAAFPGGDFLQRTLQVYARRGVSSASAVNGRNRHQLPLNAHSPERSRDRQGARPMSVRRIDVRSASTTRPSSPAMIEEAMPRLLARRGQRRASHEARRSTSSRQQPGITIPTRHEAGVKQNYSTRRSQRSNETQAHQEGPRLVSLGPARRHRRSG